MPIVTQGQEIQVRRRGEGTRWVTARVELVSGNQESLALSAEHGLGTSVGFGLDRTTGGMMLLLFKQGEHYTDVHSGCQWEVRP
jgi:hypothetical protein